MKEYDSAILGEKIVILKKGEKYDGPLVSYPQSMLTAIKSAGVVTEKELKWIHTVMKVLQFKEDK